MPSCFDELEDEGVPDSLTSHTEFARLLSDASDSDDFDQRILAILNTLGFSDYAVVRKISGGGMEVPVSSIPKELIAIYHAKKYCRHDMVLDYMETGNPEPIYLSTIARVIEGGPLLTYTFKQNLKILALYKRFEVNDAYLIPVGNHRHTDRCTDKQRNNDRTLFSIMAKGATQNEFLERVKYCQTALQALAEAVSCIAESRFYPWRTRQSINPRPLRLLTTMAKQDLSLTQAANRLCISIDTANKHMALAKKALGTSSQANAVYLAVKLGLIE